MADRDRWGESVCERERERVLKESLFLEHIDDDEVYCQCKFLFSDLHFHTHIFIENKKFIQEIKLFP